MKQLTQQQVKKFHHDVYSYFKKNGRDLPWRTTHDPYAIVVSEIMLQQTQVDRVIDKYQSFLKRFPNFQKLAAAPLQSVLSEWQGLGYNRRALHVKKLAEIVVRDYQGKLPRDQEELVRLPGIGQYTASAIRAFAFNEPSVFIETNIRTVYIHYFFPVAKKIHDRDLLPVIAQTLDHQHAREWFSALMDYGAYLKSQYPNPSRRSVHHVRQKPFKGSNRELRGMLLRQLTMQGAQTKHQLEKSIGSDAKKISSVLSQLIHEGLITRSRSRYEVAS